MNTIPENWQKLFKEFIEEYRWRFPKDTRCDAEIRAEISEYFFPRGLFLKVNGEYFGYPKLTEQSVKNIKAKMMARWQ